jgi:CubicO group peptidase (beta-lactamase class C family)
VAGDGDFGLSPGVLNVLATPALPPMKGLRDKVLHVDTMFSLGFIKPFSKFVFGSSNKAFGTAGAGGSFGFADPDTGIGFAYVMNRMGFHLWNDPRELALRQALFRDVLRARPQL